MTDPPILFIPLDNRPCCLQFTERLAQIAGQSLWTPPAHLLGDLNTPASCDEILAWLKEACQRSPQAKILASLDMCSWGGLVASRRPPTSFDLVQQRLQQFAEITQQHPVWSFMTLMRVAPTQTDRSEVQLANKLVEFSYLDSLLQKNSSTLIQKQRWQELKKAIPLSYLQSYIRQRQNHFQWNLQCQKLAQKYHWQHLHLGIDDSKTEGWNIQERDQLQKEALRLKLPYTFASGTDEVAHLLLARILSPQKKIVHLWSQKSSPQQITRYEDQPLEKVLTQQLWATGSTSYHFDPAPGRESQLKKSLREEQHHLPLLAIYTPHGQQMEASAQNRSGTTQRAKRFIQNLSNIQQKNPQRAIILADLSYANGGDLKLYKELIEQELLPKLFGYFGWNTAGNTLGSAIALTLLSPKKHNGTHQRFLLERLLDDLVYQGKLRQQLRKRSQPRLNLTLDQLDDHQHHLGLSLQKELDLLNQQFNTHYHLKKASYPWHRWFEIGLELQLPPS